MSDFDDDIDDIVSALTANGWNKPLNTGAIAKEDEAVMAKLFGVTNARRAANTPRDRKVRMVRTTEVYAVENSRGWILGGIEGGRRKVLAQDLPWEECRRGLSIAEAKGYRTVVHSNPVRARQPVTRRSSAPWIDPSGGAGAKSKPATPSKRVGPSKALAILDQLRDFKA
jgi:hypothetical protein